MGIAYDPTIPSTGGRPSAQYTDIQTNFNSIQTLIDIDHVDFNDADYGKHSQVTIPAVTAPVAQTNPQSVLYTQNGVAVSISDLAFRNQTGTFPITFIRAFALLDASGAILSSQSFNVASIAAGPGGSKDITFNCVTGTAFGVLGLKSGASVPFNYSIIGAAQIRVSSNSFSSTILILQV